MKEDRKKCHLKYVKKSTIFLLFSFFGKLDKIHKTQCRIAYFALLHYQTKPPYLYSIEKLCIK